MNEFEQQWLELQTKHAALETFVMMLTRALVQISPELSDLIRQMHASGMPPLQAQSPSELQQAIDRLVAFAVRDDDVNQ